MIRLSIIMPIYNVERYLVSAIESVVNAYIDGTELILIDDGSTDKSGSIAAQYSKTFWWISSYTQANGGLSSARNNGLLKAKGEYIFFMDSDDFISSNLLIDFENLIKKESSDIVIFDYQAVDEQGKNIPSYYGHHSILKNQVSISINEALNSIWLRNIATTSWSFIVKRNILNKLVPVFDNGKKFEDTNTTPLIFSYANKINILNKQNAYYYYRQRSNSIMAEKSLRDAKDLVFITNDLISNFNFDNPLFARYIYSLIQIYLMDANHREEIKYPVEIKDMLSILKESWKYMSDKSTKDRVKHIIVMNNHFRKSYKKLVLKFKN